MPKLSQADLSETLEVNILSYWAKNMPDKTNGGFYGRIDGNDVIEHKADKGIILNARLLWTFSTAYGNSDNKKYLDLAYRAYDFIVKKFVDTTYGGVYWMVDYLGRPIERKKQIYGQSFVIYGLAEFYKISKEESALKFAIDLFGLIEKYAFDSESNGYIEAFDETWNDLDDVRLSEKDINAHKTMNTHLHILEAYTNLYTVWPDNGLKAQLGNLMNVMLDRFIASNYHFNLFFDKHWTLLSHEISYGHAIEGSWLLTEAAKVVNDPNLIARVEKVAIQMLEASLEGLDVDGGLMNEGDANGITDSTKHWWPQAEALVGLVNGYQLTGDEKYLQTAQRVWDFINERLIDKENGEWHWKVSKEGNQDYHEDKAGPWKCPYHNGRAMIELMRRLP